jgi:2-polyprenyl-6-methoxyphenol hydroxylase-like FAD-dependent oxidoreductase
MVRSWTPKAPRDIWDVVIIGLGPAGLTLAHLLGRRGLRVLALEREPEFYGNARAVYTDDECMRIFQAAGIANELDTGMILDCPVQWVLKDGSVFGQLRRFDRPNGWTMSNFFYQPFLETRMEELLSRYPNVVALRGRTSSASIKRRAKSSSRMWRAKAQSTDRPALPRRRRRTRRGWARAGSSPATVAVASSAAVSASR